MFSSSVWNLPSVFFQMQLLLLLHFSHVQHIVARENFLIPIVLLQKHHSWPLGVCKNPKHWYGEIFGHSLQGKKYSKNQCLVDKIYCSIDNLAIDQCPTMISYWTRNIMKKSQTIVFKNGMLWLCNKLHLFVRYFLFSIFLKLPCSFDLSYSIQVLTTSTTV